MSKIEEDVDAPITDVSFTAVYEDLKPESPVVIKNHTICMETLMDGGLDPNNRTKLIMPPSNMNKVEAEFLQQHQDRGHISYTRIK